MTSKNKYKSVYQKSEEKDLDEIKLEARPKYLKNMVNYFQVGRLTGVDVKNNLFKEIVVYDAQLELSGGEEGEITIVHGLGYRPLFWGSYSLNENTVIGADAYPMPFKGMIDQPKHSPYGAVYPFGQNGVFTQEIDENKIVLRTQFGCETGNVSIKLRILREKNV